MLIVIVIAYVHITGSGLLKASSVLHAHKGSSKQHVLRLSTAASQILSLALSVLHQLPAANAALNLPEMEQARRDAYRAAYINAMRRHGMPGAHLATLTATKATASTEAAKSDSMNFGVAATRSLGIVLTYLAWTIARIGYYVILPTMSFFLLLLLLGVPQWERWVNETLVQLQQGHWYLQPNYGSAAFNTAIVIVLCFIHPIRVARAAGNGIRAAVQGLRAWYDTKIHNIRRNPRTAELLLEYQMLKNWVSRYILLILYALFVFWLFSGFIAFGGDREGKTKFVPWKDFQPSFTNPIPQMLYYTRKAEGSNSHYRRDEPPEPAEPIPQVGVDDDVDVEELPVTTIHEEWHSSPHLEPSTSESTTDSAREDITAVRLPDTFTSEHGWQDVGHAHIHARPPSTLR